MNNDYTVIIPTMWRSPDYIIKMLGLYCKSQYVNEIIIIDNDVSKRIKNKILDHKKIRILSNNRNLYVNPSWNWGVSQSKSKKIIIANDDIFIKDFEFLINQVDDFLQPNMVVGSAKSCFSESTLKISIDKCNENMNWGWGTFIIMHKNSYVYVPKELLIWHGDDIQFNTNESYAFKGIHIETKMSTTILSMNARTLAREDTNKFKKYYDDKGNLINYNKHKKQ